MTDRTILSVSSKNAETIKRVAYGIRSIVNTDERSAWAVLAEQLIEGLACVIALGVDDNEHLKIALDKFPKLLGEKIVHYATNAPTETRQ